MNKLKLKDIGRKITSDKIVVVILDNDGKELYAGLNPFKSTVSPLSLQYIHDYMDREVTDIDAGIITLENGNSYTCIKITTEANSLFSTVEKAANAEPSGSRFIISIYKNDKPLKTGLMYVNNGGEFNMSKIDGLLIYQHSEVKKIEKSYNDQGYKEIKFYI